MRRSSVPLLVAGLLTGGGVFPAAAQQSVSPRFVLDPIVVTATRTPTPSSSLGFSTEVVTGQEIRMRGATSLYDILTTLPGLVGAQAGPAGGTASIFLRGAKNEHLLVLVDGVRVGDPANTTGGFDWGTFPVGAIDRVEVVKGPQSAVWGSDAIAGVVNIITREPTDRTTLSGVFEGGSYRTTDADLSIGGRAGETGYLIQAGRRSLLGPSAALAGGTADRDGLAAFSGSVALSRALAAGKLRFSVHGERSRADLDDFGGPGGDDPDSRSWKAAGSTSLVYQRRTGETGEQQFRLGYSLTHRWLRDRSDAAHPGEAADGDWLGRTLQAGWTGRYASGRSTLSGGLEALREQGRTSYSSSDGTFTFDDMLAARSRWSGGVFLQDQVSMGASSLVAGARLDAFSGEGLHPTFRGGLTLPAGPVGVHLSAGTGYKVPALYQRYHTFYGDPDLVAEQAFSWEAGIDWRPSPVLRAGVVRFAQSVRDLIDFDGSAGRYANLDRARMDGWEVSGQAVLSADWLLSGSLTFLEAVDRTSGTRLLRRPARTAALRLERRDPDGLILGGGGRLTGARPDLDFSSFPAVRVTLPEVWVFDASASYPIADGVRIRLRVEDMTDQAPVWVYGYESPGRALYLGVVLDR